MILTTRMLVNLVLLTCVIIGLPATAFAQTSGARSSAPAVTELVAAVKDIAALEGARKAGGETLLFALASMHGALIAAGKKVVESKQETAAIFAIVSILKTCKDSARPGDGTLCARGAFALEHLGPAAKTAVPTLQLRRNHRDSFAATAASEVLEKLQK